MVDAKPTSLPPIVTLTSSVLEVSADSWLDRSVLVVAPLQATERKDFGECAVFHSPGYAFELRMQVPVCPDVPTPDE
jgi:hypothetical protein